MIRVGYFGGGLYPVLGCLPGHECVDGHPDCSGYSFVNEDGENFRTPCWKCREAYYNEEDAKTRLKRERRRARRRLENLCEVDLAAGLAAMR